ncbi:hypothetical protein PBY51_020132 [Eleginops maclovinus]|uniref:Uncharacterized protein n=1 Tax=Eleginops maclovinus TaxID=56733 RepID=A0AAN7XTZ1_ELEMC|nr:hypothetical protein PBY51_020132 [Eleginops maclovinus]
MRLQGRAEERQTPNLPKRWTKAICLKKREEGGEERDGQPKRDKEAGGGEREVVDPHCQRRLTDKRASESMLVRPDMLPNTQTSDT